MKLQLDYVITDLDSGKIHGNGTIQSTSPLSLGNSEAKILTELRKLYHNEKFKVVPVAVSVVDDNPSSWMAALIAVALVLGAGIAAAGICMVIMRLIR